MANPAFNTPASKIKSKNNENLVIAYQLGYRVINGEVFSKTGEKLKQNVAQNGYLRFYGISGSRTDNTRNTFKIHTHRLVAYQKYGDNLFDYECVRHLDGDKLNNHPANISIGSMSENMRDIPLKVRKERASLAGRKYTDDMIKNIKDFYNHVKSYSITMKKFEISSKGSLWHILNNDYLSVF